MATELNEMQFELLPGATAPAGQVFGIGAGVSIDDGGFDPGDDEWTDQDEENPSRGGTAFGRDLLKGPTWAFDLHVNQEDVYTAKAALKEFKTAWRALHIRDVPGAVIPLRYRVADEIRKVYGRPRRLAAPPDNKILSGYIPVTCDFKCVDGYTYDDEPSTVTLSLQATGVSEGGFIFPVVFPVDTLPVGDSRQQAVVGGDAPTYPVIRFNGPVTNPELSTPEWTLALKVALGPTEYVEVDTRPWGLTILRNGVSSEAGALGRRTYLKDMKFHPGRHDLTYRGSSASSTSTCEVRWSNASNSI